MINTRFTYDGISSDEMGISLVRLNRGMYGKQYTSGKQILENFPNKSLYPYFFGVKHEPLKFKMTITCENTNMDSDKLYDLGNWLFKNEYKPIVFDDNVSVKYYCIAVNQAEFMTNGLEQGYFEVEMRCRDGFGWTNEIIQEFDFTGITTPQTIQLTNHSNVLDYYYPEVEFELTGANTGVSLVNNNDSAREFSFAGLNALETVYVDCQKKVIISSTNLNRFDKFNKTFLRLKKGINNIVVTGECVLNIRSQFPVFT